MNWELFSPIGYTGVVLLACVPLLWLAHVLIRPRKWLGHVAVVCAIGAYVLAQVNSSSYVNRIQVDQSEVIEKAMAARDLARQQAEQENQLREQAGQLANDADKGRNRALDLLRRLRLQRRQQ